MGLIALEDLKETVEINRLHYRSRKDSRDVIQKVIDRSTREALCEYPHSYSPKDACGTTRHKSSSGVEGIEHVQPFEIYVFIVQVFNFLKNCFHA